MISLAAMGCLAASCGQKPGKEAQAREWASRLLKDKGIEVAFHPSTDFVELKRQYEANTELWVASLECLAKTIPQIGEISEFGTRELVGKDCYAVYSEIVPKPIGNTKLEGHKKFIDIQFMEGPVEWGVCPSDSPNLQILSEYDPSKDAGFYLSDDTLYYTQEKDEPYIFVFFPHDLHNPSFAVEGYDYTRPLKKIVIKVAAAE